MKAPLHLLLLVLLCSCSKLDLQLEHATIFPGTGIKEISLTDPIGKALNDFGPPDSWLAVADLNLIEWENLGIALEFSGRSDSIPSTAKINAIQIKSPYEGITKEGLNIGSSKSEVVSKYGEEKYFSFFGFGYYEPPLEILYEEDIVTAFRLKD